MLTVRNPDGVVMYDMGDYSTRFVAQLNITLPARQQSVNAAFQVNDSEFFATIVEGNSSLVAGILYTSLLAIAQNGSIQVTALDGAVSYDRPVKVDVYKFA
ncbi:Uncharacterised protein [Klebsiella grimontii]|nr:Uncharacterised protein [Klebsiella grimontii]